MNFDRDNTPTFTGTVTGLTSYANQTVQIRDSLTTLGIAKVASDGSWSFDFGSGAGASQTAGRVLTDGAHNINVRLQSNLGVTSSYKVTIDTQTTTPTAFASPASTYIDQGGTTHIITNTSYPVISGRGEPGAEIDIFNRNAPLTSYDTTLPQSDPDYLPPDQRFNFIGATQVDSAGNYSYELKILNDDGTVDKNASTSLVPDGVYNIGVTSTDPAGNYAAGTPVVLEVDTLVDPAFVYSLDTNPAANTDGAVAVNGVVFTNDSTPTIKGYAETGSEVTVKDAAGNVLGVAVANGNPVTVGGKVQSQFTFEVDNAHTLSQGVHSLSLTTTDRAGNVSAPTSMIIGVDSQTVAPTVSLASSVSSRGVEYTNDNTPTLSGTAEPGATVAFTDTAGNSLGSVVANATTGAYSFTPTTPMSDGAKTITATATDALGNKNTTTHDVTVDTISTAPTLASATAVKQGDVTYNNDSTPIITGTAEAGSTVTIKDGTTVLGTTTAGSNGTYSFEVPTTKGLSEGTHTLNVTATDVAGNVSSTSTQSVTIDTRAPNAPTESIAASPTVTYRGVTYDTDRTPTISGTAEAGSTVTIKDGNTTLGTTVAGADGAYSFTLADENQLAGGTHQINVLATDLAGNTSSASAQSLSVVCYLAGTRMKTKDGWKQVEQLEVGDLLQTVSGELQPVMWLGHSTIDCRRQENKKHAYPVRIAQHAFGHQLPSRDLYVSPLHSIYVGGVMIPAIHLVNGVSVTQEQQETLVTYYHVELPQHNVVFAEGLPAETYLDTTPENRHFFSANKADQKVFPINRLFPACPQGTPVWQHIWDTQGYAPLTQSGPILEAVKASLMERAQQLAQEDKRLTA